MYVLYITGMMRGGMAGRGGPPPGMRGPPPGMMRGQGKTTTTLPKFKLYLFYNDYKTSYTNHARWHLC